MAPRTLLSTVVPPKQKGHGHGLRAVLAGLVVAALAVAGLVAVPEVASAAPASTVSVSGTVTDTSNTPISGYNVTIYQVTSGGGWSGSWSADTDANGVYTVDSLEPGTYTVWFGAYGSTDAPWIPQYWQNKTTMSDATTFTLAAGGAATGISASLTRGASISGTVTGSDTGAGIGNFYVYALDAQNNQVGYGYVQSNGQYTISSLAAGDYTLHFETNNDSDYLGEYWNDKANVSVADRFSVAAGADVTGKDAVLAVGTTISGTVTGPDSDPLQSAEVDVYSGSSNLGYAFTDSEGLYTLHGLAPGSYTLRFSGPYGQNLITQWWDGASSQTQATSVTVGTTPVTGKDAQLTTGASISGRVVGGDTGAGVVTNVFAYDHNQSVVGQTTTDSSGNYTISALPQGSYTLQTYSYSSSAYLSQYWSGQPSFATAQFFDVGASETVTGKDFVLVAGASISGTVTASDTGLPLANVGVYANSDGTSGSNTFYTDSSGHYTITGLATGSYKVQFTGPTSASYISEWYDNQASQSAATAISVTAGAETTAINAALAPGITVSGKVTTAESAGATGLAYAQVSLNSPFDSPTQVSRYVSADASGNYSLTGLPAGTYQLSVSGNSYVSQTRSITLAADGDYSGTNFTLVKGASISGTVTGSDTGTTGLSSGYVNAYTPSGGYAGYANLDSTGGYTLSGLAAGSYVLSFTYYGTGNYVSDYYSNKPTSATADVITVAAGQVVTGKNEVLAKGATISGTVIGSDTQAAVANVYVDAYTSAGYAGSTRTDDSGHYSITGLRPGSYTLEFESYFAGSNYDTQWWTTATSQANATYFDLVAGASLVKNATLTAKGSIAGTVTSSGNAPVAGAQVQAYSTTYEYSARKTTYTDSSGHYSLAGLDSGKYKVRFTMTAQNLVAQWYAGSKTFDTATPVTAKLGTVTSGIDAQLVAGAQISGTVAGADAPSTGLGNIEVDLYDAAGNQVDYRYTASDGSYTFQGLNAGSYAIQVRPASGRYLGQWSGGEDSFKHATRFSVAAGATSNQSFSLVVGGTIAGVVNGPDHQPLANAVVELYSPDRDDWSQSSTAVTAADGTYSFPGLEAGDYKLRYALSSLNLTTEWWDDAPTSDTADVVPVTLGATSALHAVELTTGSMISGTVSGSDATNVGLAGARVVLYQGGDQVDSGYTDADGHYVFAGLSAGKYTIRFEPPFGSSYLESQWGTSDDALTTISVVKGSNVTDIDGVLPTGASVSGTVTGTGSAPLANAQVMLYTGEDGYFYSLESVHADSNGHFSFSGLEAGSYKVRYALTSQNYATQWWQGKSTEDAADPLQLSAGTSTVLDATLVTGGTVTGTVSLAPGATAPLDYGYVYLYDAAGNYVTSDYYDSDGVYSFTGVAPGQYTLYFGTAYPSGYVSQWLGGGSTSDGATTFTVASDQIVTRDAVLQRGSSISGTVFNSVDNTVAGARVTVFSREGDSDYFFQSDSTTSGSDGSYTLTGLTTGDYKIRYALTSQNYISQWWDGKSTMDDATIVPVTGSQAITGYHVTLQSGGSVSGTITGADAAGVPVTDTYVYLYDTNGNEVSSVYSRYGDYSFTGITPGTYYLEGFGDGSYVDTITPPFTIAVGSTLTQNIVLTTGGSVTGTVTDSDSHAGLAQVTVDVIDKATGESYGQDVTSTTGRYIIKGVPTGDYTLRFTHPASGNYATTWWGGASQSSSTTFGVTAGTAAVVKDIALVAGYAVTGTVTDAVSTDPVADFFVQAYNTSGDVVGSASTSALGTYKLRGLSAGTYTLNFSSDSSSYAYQWLGGAATKSKASTFTVSSTQNGSTDKNAAVVQGGTISGSVTTTTVGYGVAVTAYDADDSPVAHAYAYPQTAGGPQVYTLRNLPTGQYTVGFDNYDPSTGQESQQYWHGASSLAKATRFTVTAGANTPGIDAAFGSSSGATVTAGTPTIANSAAVGDVLTVDEGTWTGGAITFSYQWKSGGTAISGATSRSYVVRAADLGKTISVTVTGAIGSSTASADSNSSAAVVAGTIVSVKPVISGTPQVGKTLTVTPGTWTPNSTSLSYKWYRGSTVITGATALTYTLTAADLGALISVEVTGSADGYTTAIVPSAQTTAVASGVLDAPKPTITGSLAVGSIVTADTTGWGPLPLGLTYSWNGAGTTTTGATYTIVTADVGHTLTVTVTATRAGFTTATVASDPSAAVSSVALTASNPTITGSLTVGSTLTASITDWSATPDTVTYSWSRGSTIISGATTANYTLVAADAGKTITATVVGTKATYATATKSTTTAVIASGTMIAPIPTVSGDLIVGHVLTATPGTWAPANAVFTYQWRRNNAAITGATASTYQLAPADAGATVTVTVTGTADGYTTASQTSVSTTPVGTAPLTTEIPTVTGTPTVGQTLTAVPGTWGPGTVSFAYSWLRNNVAIPGANGATYTLTPDDVGAAISVSITGSKTGYTTETKSGPAMGPVAAASLSTGTPSITGSSIVDSVLTANSGAWGPGAVSLSYSWARGGSAIAGATGTTYAVTAADLGSTITVTVTGSKSGYTTESRTSAATGTVGAALLTAATPVISGTASVGSTLTATVAPWGPGAVGLAFQWLRNGVPIPGAVGAAYALAKADAATSVSVSVTGTRSGYASTTTVSAPVVVTNAFEAVKSASIAGKAKVGAKLTATVKTSKVKGTKVTIQWFRNGKKIAKATKTTYKLAKKDVGKKITYVVTESKKGYATKKITSKATKKVAK